MILGLLARPIIKVALAVFLLLAAYFGITFAQVVSAARRGPAEGPAEAIIVLGAAQFDGTPSQVFKARLDHAVELWSDEVAPVLVVTGGRQPGDRFTEASAAAQYLIAAGVPESALRLETDSHNSWQSLAAAARFLRDEGITDVVLVSSPYHALRIEHIADEVGLDARASPAPGAGTGTFPRLVRETLAVGVGRVIGHRRLVDLDDRVGRLQESDERP